MPPVWCVCLLQRAVLPIPESLLVGHRPGKHRPVKDKQQRRTPERLAVEPAAATRGAYKPHSSESRTRRTAASFLRLGPKRPGSITIPPFGFFCRAASDRDLPSSRDNPDRQGAHTMRRLLSHWRGRPVPVRRYAEEYAASSRQGGQWARKFRVLDRAPEYVLHEENWHAVVSRNAQCRTALSVFSSLGRPAPRSERVWRKGIGEHSALPDFQPPGVLTSYRSK
jgi:hypothetical protein